MFTLHIIYKFTVNIKYKNYTNKYLHFSRYAMLWKYLGYDCIKKNRFMIRIDSILYAIYELNSVYDFILLNQYYD